MNLRPFACAATLLLGAGAADAAPKAAVFDFQFADLAAQPPTQADMARLPRISAELRKLLGESGLYEIVPIGPVAAEVEASAPLRACGGCAATFAQKLGADVAITGEIQKVSNLILNLNVYILDVDGKTPERAYSVDMRGDTDESFDRAVHYIVRHNILKQ